MQSTYRVPRTGTGLVAILAALIPLAAPSTGIAADAAGSQKELLARGAGYTDKQENTRVKAVQRKLRRLGHRPGPVDGLYGPLTEGSVRRFQHAARVQVDGIVGPRTSQALVTAGQRLRVAQRAQNRRVAERRRVAKRKTVKRRVQAAMANLFAVGLRPETVRGERPEAAEDDENQPVSGALIAVVLMGSALAAAAARMTPSKGSSNGAAVAPLPAAVPPKRALAAVEAPAPAPPPAPARVIGYVSVPEAEQLDRELLNRQIADIHRVCDQRGWTLAEMVRDVEGARGTSRDRPGLQYALGLMADGDAGCLVVSQMRRLSRAAADIGTILRSIAGSRGRLVALDLDIDTATKDGRKAANALISMSKWERERVAERTRKGLEAARARGGSISRPSVEDKPALKEWIAAMRARGLTLQAIADRLNEEGVPTLRGGKEWRPSSVQAAAGYRRPPRAWPGAKSESRGA
jgi:DNA invertase Pin-like site-specific DNA recombinase/peptidoglycan hydrolase-like protein with peptidoglycan-binding domain